MKRYFIFCAGALFLAGATLLSSCSAADDILDDLTEDNSGSGSGSGDSGVTGASGCLLSFDVAWDSLSTETFNDVAETVPTDSKADYYDDFVENSSFTSTIKIVYNGTSATVSGAADDVTVTADGADVTVSSSAKNVAYELSGASTAGSFKIYSDKKFKLTLNGLTLTAAHGAALNIQSKKRAFIVVADGTENALTDASSYTNTPDGEDQKGCIFAEGQLLFSGGGALTVNGHYKHGICSDEYVYFHSGPTITVASAPKDAVHTNEKIIVGGGRLVVEPSSDGLDCEEGNIIVSGGLVKARITGAASKGLKSALGMTLSGGSILVMNSGAAEYDSSDNDISSPAAIKAGGNLTVSGATLKLKSSGAAGKGISCDSVVTITDGSIDVVTTGKQFVYGSLDSSPKGIKADGNLYISGGTIRVAATGGEGSEGIESKDRMTIDGGSIAVHTYDDALNATNDITINGGQIYCYSDGNDAIDSNGTLTITGGTIVASGTTAPEAAFDCDQNTFTITGGTLIGIGGDTSTPTASVSRQASLVYGGQVTSGALFTISAADGTPIASYTVPRAYNQATILFSSSSLQQGSTYSISTGGTLTAPQSSFYGLYTGGTLSGATSTASFTQSSVVTTVGTTGGQGGNPGGQGGPGGNQGGGAGRP